MKIDTNASSVPCAITIQLEPHEVVELELPRGWEYKLHLTSLEASRLLAELGQALTMALAIDADAEQVRAYEQRQTDAAERGVPSGMEPDA